MFYVLCKGEAGVSKHVGEVNDPAKFDLAV